MSVTLSDTCGLRTFMVGGSISSNLFEISETKKSAALPAAVLAAVLPQVVRQPAKGVVVGGVVVEGPLPTGTDDTRIDEPLEVVAESGRRHVHMRLDRPRGSAFRPDLHHVAQDGQAERVAEGPQLLRKPIQLPAHPPISTIVELVTQGPTTSCIASGD